MSSLTIFLIGSFVSILCLVFLVITLLELRKAGVEATRPAAKKADN